MAHYLDKGIQHLTNAAQAANRLAFAAKEMDNDQEKADRFSENAIAYDKAAMILEGIRNAELRP